jgi:hypothetical protein
MLDNLCVLKHVATSRQSGNQALVGPGARKISFFSWKKTLNKDKSKKHDGSLSREPKLKKNLRAERGGT